MRSSSAVAIAIVIAAGTARAQPAPGFAVERYYASAPGAGWLVMDDLDIGRELAGALSFTLGYAHDPLVVAGTSVVEHEAFSEIGAAISYRRVRLYANFTSPLAILGDGDAAPHVDLGNTPDAISDPRVGVDVLLAGEPGAAFRFGAGAQLYVPNGKREDYDTDDTFRAMFRALVAGDAGRYSYAAQLGVHVRPLDESSIAGDPQGSELLFGVAGGARLPLPCAAITIGPEIVGATAFRSFFGWDTTAIEGLLSARFETLGPGRNVRVKLGIGGGIDPNFGAPEWRAIASVEVFAAATKHP
ncbi:MAG TPA: hypothetical protein VGL61_19735 [Kofleriaceae bacterium]|jgi:hypothetical protein